MNHHFSDSTRVKHLLFPFARRRACSPNTSIPEQPENDLVSTLIIIRNIRNAIHLTNMSRHKSARDTR